MCIFCGILSETLRFMFHVEHTYLRLYSLSLDAYLNVPGLGASLLLIGRFTTRFYPNWGFFLRD